MEGDFTGKGITLKEKMENKGLLFIPDISGFTRFVNETEIEHSRLVIQELLETLINTNRIGLEISEIEGDAILFYKFGEMPPLESLYKQVEAMFCEFHKQLIAYDHTRFCQCKACKSAVDLTLKVITHYGEFTGYNVKNFNKLIGKDIIVAHQLLKNDIEQHEYWLVTDCLAPQKPLSGPEPWMLWNSSAKKTETGEIPFFYTQLSELKNDLKVDQLPSPDLSGKVRVLSVSREYETDIITLFHATGEFNFRPRWQEGVQKMEELQHWLPRVGMRSRLVLDNGQTIVMATSYSYQRDHIEFSEMEEKTGEVTYFTLHATGGSKTRLTIDLYRNKNLLGDWLFNLTKKKKLAASYQRSLVNIDRLLKEMPSFAIKPE